MQISADAQELLTVDEVAERLRVSRGSVYRHCAPGGFRRCGSRSSGRGGSRRRRWKRCSGRRGGRRSDAPVRHLGFSDERFVAGDEQSRRAARDELRRRQRLRAAARNGWPELRREDLAFGDFYVEHGPTGDLFLRMLGEVSEGHRDAADAYFVADDGWPVFLERPRSGPKTRAELEERQK